MPLPESVRLKILRAKEHFDVFLRDMGVEFQRHADELMVYLDPDLDSGPSIESEVPGRIPLIIGDCLQNLRSSLDYVVWELVLANDDVPGRKNAFPICESPESFNKARKSRLAGLSEDMRAEIQCLQPYHAPDGFKSHPLWILDELVNFNKHRRILLTDFAFGWIGKSLQTGRYAIASSPSDPMYMDIQATAYVSINERDVIDTPRDLSEVVRWLINETEAAASNFDRFFK